MKLSFSDIVCGFAGTLIPTVSLHAALLEIDLSIVNQITIAATDEASFITASESDFIGVYLDGFFDGNTLSVFSS